MRVLCVARHPMLSEHLCRFFERFDLAAVPCVGVEQAYGMIPTYDPDLVLCDYDILTRRALDRWRGDAAASRVPVVAVSMTKRPTESRLADRKSIAGYVYLPTAEPDVVRQLLASARRRRDGVASPNQLPWPATNLIARIR